MFYDFGFIYTAKLTCIVLSSIYSSTACRAHSPYFSQCSIFYSLCAFVTPATNSHLKFVVHQNVLLNKSAAHKTQKQYKRWNEVRREGDERRENGKKRERERQRKKKKRYPLRQTVCATALVDWVLVGTGKLPICIRHKTISKSPRNTFPFTMNRSGNVRKNHV